MQRVITITSRENPLVARIRRLTGQADAYRKQGKVWLEGEHLCRAWIERHGGQDVQAVIDETSWHAGVLADVAGACSAVAVVPASLMSAMSSLDTPTAIAFAVDWPGEGTVRPGRAAIVLDRLQDPGNVGTILRSAAAFGFGQVIALHGTAALWAPKVMRAAMGAHLGLNLVEGASLDALDALEMPLLGTSSHSMVDICSARLPWPCAWVVGNEGQGVAEALVDRCEQLLRIPQPGGEESLNVSIAASICMYESARRSLPA
ncbi:MAG: RNA methyltransferase [Caldimonas sp.]